MGRNIVNMKDGIHILRNDGDSYILKKGSMEWIDGETVDTGATFKRSCAVQISRGEYIVLGGVSSKKVRKYNVVDKKWVEMPDLKKTYYGYHACVFLPHANPPYIIATGGSKPYHGPLTTTELYYLNGTSELAGELNFGRRYHILVKVNANPPTVYVMGHKKEIEVWDEVNKQWNITDIELNPRRTKYGAIAVPQHTVCLDN